MERIQGFEWEDLGWFPPRLRRYQTDFLAHLARKTQMFLPVVPILSETLKTMNAPIVLDIGSGSGGGMGALHTAIAEEIPLLQTQLSDLYPQPKTWKRLCEEHPGLTAIPESVDALDIPSHHLGMRTFFLSFHHFSPEKARQILANAARDRTPIAIVEGQDRSLVSLLGMLFSPITLFLVTPQITPLEGWRLVFTYVIPILPLVVMWDGVLSCLRTYSVSELRALIATLPDGSDMDWKVGRVRSGPIILTYLVGVPRENSREHGRSNQ